MKKVIVALLIAFSMLLVCVGIAAITYIALRPSAGLNSLFSSVNLAKISAEITEEYDYATSGIAFMDVQTQFGNISVTGSPDSKVHVTAHKTAWGVDQAAAQQALKDTNVVITQDQGHFTIRVEQKTPMNVLNNANAASVDFTLEVPVQTTVIANSNSGRVELTGTQGKADLSSDFGDVSATDFLGGLSARSKSGRISARRIGLLPSGDGDISLQSEFGDVSLDDVKVNHVTAHSGSGSVSANNTTSANEADLSSDFGSITYRTGAANSLKVSAKSGAVNLTDLQISGSVIAHSDFGSLNLTQVTAGSYDLSSNSGTVNSDVAQGVFKANSRFGNIEISGGNQASLDLQTSNGQVSYRGSLGAGPHTLKSDFGGIRISLPKDSSFNFDLQTDLGKISSDFKVAIEGAPNENHWKGTVGKGGSLITAQTKNGSLNLESYLP